MKESKKHCIFITLLSHVSIDNVYRQKCQQQQHVTVTIALALATLDGKTQIGSFLLFVVPPKVAKVSRVMTVACDYN
jgi:hypothetical protein